MWHIFTGPDVLVYLDASYSVAQQRRPSGMTHSSWKRVNQRLSHARAHADICINTDQLSISEIVARIATYIVETGSGAAGA
jgi:hypothetical protein